MATEGPLKKDAYESVDRILDRDDGLVYERVPVPDRADQFFDVQARRTSRKGEQNADPVALEAEHVQVLQRIAKASEHPQSPLLWVVRVGQSRSISGRSSMMGRRSSLADIGRLGLPVSGLASSSEMTPARMIAASRRVSGQRRLGPGSRTHPRIEVR